MAKRWYSVSVLSNFEKKVAEQIRQAVAENGLEDEIEEVHKSRPKRSSRFAAARRSAASAG